MTSAYRVVAGPTHGRVLSIREYEVCMPWCTDRGIFGKLEPAAVAIDLDFNRTVYQVRRIRIPMSTGGIRWTYEEMVLVPTWCSAETAAAALRELGIPPR